MAIAHISYLSELLQRPVDLNILLPENAEPQGLLIMLHGYYDRYDCTLRYSGLERYCAGLPLAVVMPNAENGFYLNTATGLPYWDQLTREIPRVLKQWFHLSFPREKCFVGGISMGGYGAAKLALTFPEHFSRAFLYSPAVDLVKVAAQGFDRTVDPNAPRLEDMHLDQLIGSRTLQGSDDDLYHLLDTADAGSLPSFHIFAGTEDFLLADDLAFRDRLQSMGVSVDMDTSAGIHNWDTWDPFLRVMIREIREAL